MAELAVIIVFAVCAAFAEAKIVERDPPDSVEMATVSDEEFAKAVEVEKEWRKQ